MPHIRKYENRRLYDTEASKYVNLDEIAEMVRRGDDVTVEDSKTGRDLTQEVLLQVVLASPAGAALVPVGLLRRLIRAAANPVLSRGIDPALAQGLDLFHRQLEALERGMPTFPGWPGAVSPPPASPGSAGAAAHSATHAHDPAPAASEADPELDALRARLDALEKRLRRG